MVDEVLLQDSNVRKFYIFKNEYYRNVKIACLEQCNRITDMLHEGSSMIEMQTGAAGAR